MSEREYTFSAGDEAGGGITARSRVCTFHYQTGGGGGGNSSNRRSQALALLQQQQLQHQQRLESSAREMPSNREMPSYEEWKRRRANRPFGQEVVLLELDPKEELARRKARDQRLMSLMKPDEQDNFYTYIDHYERVQAKVQQDRETRERQKAEAARQASAEAEKRKRDQHQVQKRLEKVSLATDTQFTADVAKSKYYRLVQQEQRRGFKFREERDNFWQEQLQTKGLLRPLEQQQDGSRGMRAMAAANEPGNGGDSGEDDEAGTHRLIWEKTDDAIQLGAGGGSANHSRQAFRSMSRAQQNRMLEELFPKAERPKLASFDVDYSKKEEKSPEELKLEQLQEKRRRRLDDWREHRHMQQMAVTFSVTTRRILNERPVRDSGDHILDDDLGQLFGEALDRARRRQERPIEQGERELDITDPRLLQPWRRPPRRHRRGADDSFGGGSSTATSSAAFAVLGRPGGVGAAADRPLTTPATQSSGLGNDDSDIDDHRLTQNPRQPPLLSIGQAQSQLPQVEAKAQSTMWKNYMAAGNVRFAPLDDDQWYRAKTSTTDATATVAAAAATS